MNFAGFHTGRTTGQGGYEIKGSVSKVFDSPLFFGYDEQHPDFELIDQHAFQLGGMVGVADRVDIGAWVSLASSIGLETKVQLVGDHDSPLAVAVGAGIGLSDKFLFQIPAYLSYHPFQSQSLYLSPRFIFQRHDNYLGIYGDDPFKFLGLNAGYFASFNQFSVGFDYAFFRGFNSEMDFNTGSLSVGLRWRVVR